MTLIPPTLAVHDPPFTISVTYLADPFEFLAHARQAAECLAARTGQPWVLQGWSHDWLILRLHNPRVAEQVGPDPYFDLEVALHSTERTVTLSVRTALRAVSTAFLAYLQEFEGRLTRIAS